mmetsp:Transcript_31940/g.69928  ORF Transcript_31940/g.69928 Transcript_31940/m.69928 type:complete len:336 (-) Transcript_31940:176-1183(-)
MRVIGLGFGAAAGSWAGVMQALTSWTPRLFEESPVRSAGLVVDPEKTQVYQTDTYEPNVQNFQPMAMMDHGHDVLVTIFHPQAPRVRGKDGQVMKELYQVDRWAQNENWNLTVTFCMRCPTLDRIYRNFDVKEEDLPLTLFLPNGLTIGYHYRLGGEPRATELEKFVSKARDGTWEPFVKSEPEPEEQFPGTPVKVVGASFQREVIATREDVILFVTYGWIPQTRMWIPGLEYLTQQLAPLSGVKVAVIDESSNAVPAEFAAAWNDVGRTVGALVLFAQNSKHTPQFFDLDALQDEDAEPEHFASLVLKWVQPKLTTSFTALPTGELVPASAEDL